MTKIAGPGPGIGSGSVIQRSVSDPLVEGTDPRTGSVPKCHGSATLALSVASLRIFFHHFLDCQAASKEMLKKAESLDLDLKTKAGHYKRLRSLCKEEVKVYLQLLQTKKAAHGNSPDSVTKSRKKKKKKSESSAKEETVQAEGAPNKKIKFEEEEESGEDKDTSSAKSPDKKKLKKKKKKEKESANGGESSPEAKPKAKKPKKDDGPGGAEKEINFAVKNFKIKQIKKKKKLAANMG